MFDEVINRIMAHHDDFSYEEIEEICEDFYNSIPKKIKQETKIKRLNKFVDKEFELDKQELSLEQFNKIYSLDNIPKYLLNLF